MRVNVKETHTKITPIVWERIDALCAQLERFANVPDPDALECDIEVGKVTEHHRKGEVFRAEINFTSSGAYFRAEAEDETEVAALDRAHDEIRRQFVHRKHKEQSLVRRIGAKMKGWWHMLAERTESGV